MIRETFWFLIGAVAAAIYNLGAWLVKKLESGTTQLRDWLEGCWW